MKKELYKTIDGVKRKIFKSKWKEIEICNGSQGFLNCGHKQSSGLIADMFNQIICPECGSHLSHSTKAIRDVYYISDKRFLGFKTKVIIDTEIK